MVYNANLREIKFIFPEGETNLRMAFILIQRTVLSLLLRERKKIENSGLHTSTTSIVSFYSARWLRRVDFIRVFDIARGTHTRRASNPQWISIITLKFCGNCINVQQNAHKFRENERVREKKSANERTIMANEENEKKNACKNLETCVNAIRRVILSACIFRMTCMYRVL